MEIEEFEVRYSILYGLMLELNVLAIQPMEISVVFIMDKKLWVILYCLTRFQDLLQYLIRPNANHKLWVQLKPLQTTIFFQ